MNKIEYYQKFTMEDKRHLHPNDHYFWKEFYDETKEFRNKEIQSVIKELNQEQITKVKKWIKQRNEECITLSTALDSVPLEILILLISE